MAYMFRMIVGDDSGDGHDKTEDFCILSNKGSNEINAAWVKAKADHPELDPNSMCNDVEDWKLNDEAIKWLTEDHVDLYNTCTMTSVIDVDIIVWTEPRGYAEYVLLFTKLGDPDLELQIVNVPIFPASVGGYGLFWM